MAQTQYYNYSAVVYLQTGKFARGSAQIVRNTSQVLGSIKMEET